MDTKLQPGEATASTGNAHQHLPLDLPQVWKTRFTLLEKAGGTKMPKAKELSFGERTKLVFNIWGFVLCQLYYLKLGMWKKALSYTVLGVLLILLIEMICQSFGINGGTAGAAVNFLVPAIFGTRANVDYYKKVVLGSNGWI